MANAEEFTNLTISVGAANVNDGIHLKVDGDEFDRLHLTPQGLIMAGDGTQAPEEIAPSPAVAAKAEKVGADDIEITDDDKGLILTASDASRWRLVVATNGALSTEAVA